MSNEKKSPDASPSDLRGAAEQSRRDAVESARAAVEIFRKRDEARSRATPEKARTKAEYVERLAGTNADVDAALAAWRSDPTAAREFAVYALASSSAAESYQRAAEAAAEGRDADVADDATDATKLLAVLAMGFEEWCAGMDAADASVAEMKQRHRDAAV